MNFASASWLSFMMERGWEDTIGCRNHLIVLPWFKSRYDTTAASSNSPIQRKGSASAEMCSRKAATPLS